MAEHDRTTRPVAPAAIDGLAKKAAPKLARVVPSSVTRLTSIYLDILQGKGSGTGWDMTGEAAADASALRDVATPVIIDGGANYGQWAVAAHRTLGNPDATYVLIEPQEACIGQLQQLALPNLTVIQAALSDHQGEATIAGTMPGFPAASLYERSDTYFDDMRAHQEVVKVVTLDDVIQDRGFAVVHLLKLDVEGSELAALRGAQQSLSDGLIHAVAFEFGSANIYSRTFFMDFWDLLVPMGYDLSRVLPGGRLLPITTYSEEHEHFRGVSNYLARRS